MSTHFGGIFDYAQKAWRLQEIDAELADPGIWDLPDKAQALGRERSQLLNIVKTLDDLAQSLQDTKALLTLAQAEADQDTVNSITDDIKHIQNTIQSLEFQRMFCGPMDANNAYLEVQSGSGGTEAQDWAEMLLRMYLRWGEQHGFHCQLLEASDGDVAGIKSATVKVSGEYAYGWLRTETGVHRLVRKSPFDSGNRRHTSFAAIFVAPEVDDDIDIDVNPADLRIDTYRASGAGGQHVNRTDSAVRITHLPTNTVVQCQHDRSQHKNKAQAMKQLRAKLYELALQERLADKQSLEQSKADIGWGSQIRSYVLDSARIKDLRTGVETANTQAVLDGNIDMFIEASLKQGIT